MFVSLSDRLWRAGRGGGGHHLSLTSVFGLQGDKKVHCSHFCKPVLVTKQPKILLVSTGSSLHLWSDARRVIASQLVLASAAMPGSNFVRVCFECDWLEPRLVVWPHGRCDDK